MNESKTVTSVTTLPILGYLVSHGELKPDPDRLCPLQQLIAPHNIDSEWCVIGMFAHYSKWIPKFSEKIYPLSSNDKFPWSTFELLKKVIAGAVVQTIDSNVEFEVETDASEFTIAASLNQAGRPVAFFSRTLNQIEQKHSAIEKEACAIVESIMKWRHYLQGRKFKLITDQCSVAFMFQNKHSGKVKNEKIERWRI